jgi:membrane-associated protease RseP (regulator of RpoE activity)
VAQAETLFELDMSGDATRMLWDLARKFRSYAMELNLDADYLLYTHHYFYQTSGGDDAVGLVLYVLCDSDAEWVVAEWQSDQSTDFMAVSPKTVSDCDRLVAKRLEFHSTPQKVVGIGVSIKRDDFGHFLIAAVLEKGPAGQAGLQVNDVITKVNGQEVKDLTIKEAVDRVTGEVGTKVTITVRRNGEIKDYTLTRREVVFD